MITRTSQPASGAMLISEMKEFASFSKSTQRYIRRSLDVAYGRRDAIECWARDEGEAASIRGQSRLYKQLDHLRLQVPDDSGLDMIEPFLGMLITVSAFDLGQDRLPNFAAYRFLYARLIGAAPRPPLPRRAGRAVSRCSGRSGSRRSTSRPPPKSKVGTPASSRGLPSLQHRN